MQESVGEALTEMVPDGFVNDIIGLVVPPVKTSSNCSFTNRKGV